MAASIARRSYVFCRCVGINVIRQHVTLRNVVLRHTNNTFQSSVSYGIREAAGTQVSKINANSFCLSVVGRMPLKSPLKGTSLPTVSE